MYRMRAPIRPRRLAMVAAVVLLAVQASALAGSQQGPSFDCTGAQGVEATICADPGLSALDREAARLRVLAASGASAAELAALKDADAAWTARRDACTTSDCLRRVYLDRIATLRAASPALTADRAGISIGPLAYACRDGTRLEALFVNGPTSLLRLVFADGRTLVLKQGMSGSGARYVDDATGDVFWIKGRNAMMTLGGKETDCSTS